MTALRARIEQYFELERLGTTIHTELLAGATTFLTMAYIVIVNPSILKDAGHGAGSGDGCDLCGGGVWGRSRWGCGARHPVAAGAGQWASMPTSPTVL